MMGAVRMSSERLPAIDAEAFAELVELIGPDNPAMVVEILDTYFEEAAHLVRNIEEAAAAGDEEAMLRPVHSLKSSSASMGAQPLAQICADLEQYLRGDGAVLDVDERVRMILAEHSRAELQLAALRDLYADRNM